MPNHQLTAEEFWGVLTGTFGELDLRRLEEEADDGELIDGNDSEVLRNTLRFYGTLFLVILLVFCSIRKRFPKVYNVRKYVDELKTDLAEDQLGFIDWMWKLFFITDSEMLDECGMDALCYTRVLEFGLKLSAVGMLTAAWLIPVYATAKATDETAYIQDPIVAISVANLPSGSYRFIATVIGAYCVFGYTMYNMLKEFEWFLMFRHQFLSKKFARNYSVYVQCIPHEYRTNAKLLEFFQQASSQGAVVDALLAVKAPALKKKVQEREKLVAKLEHAINIEEVRGITPMRRSVIGPDVNLIDSLFEELHELNAFISKAIETIEAKADEGGRSITVVEESSSEVGPPLTIDYSGEEVSNDGLESAVSSEKEPPPPSSPGSPPPANLLASIRKTATKSVRNVGSAVPTQSLVELANQAKSLITHEDGEPHSAGFVTFKSLRSAQAALQMIQYPEPFAMEVLEAPQPEDIFWQNVGKTHKELQIGKLWSFAATTALCLLWTIPMTFIAGLSTVEGLKDQVPFIEKMLDKLPWLEPVLAQLAPLFIVLAQEVLKIILEILSGLEGPISGAVIQASLFSKLAAFMIIQTFFVSAIGGTLLESLSNIAQEPGLVVDILANSLPSRSTFFVQILLVDTFINMGIELLRVSPLITAGIRSRVGPRLTQKERETTWMGLRPLCDPLEFEHADLLSGTVLYFMVYFVYAVIAPVTTFFMGFCFVLMGAGYRHQFVYIYPTFPDSGGKLWVRLFRLLPVCMIIAEVTIVGMLALKKAAVASALMFPLLVITILFTIYIQQKHFAVTEHLPSRECIAIDLKNERENMDYEFLRGLYTQPELREKEILPENTTVEREIAQGCVEFVTPPNSETAGLENGETNFRL